MNKENNKLTSKITVNRHFLKSVRVDRDLQQENALDGYVALGSCINVLQRMSSTIASGINSAFTWIGPYGSGKSSLALVFSALLAEDEALRSRAAALLNLQPDDYLSQVFVNGSKQWQVISVVGTDRDLQEVLTQAAVGGGIDVNDEGLIPSLERCVSDGRRGLLLIIDEMGVFMSYALKHNGFNFLQELAEAAARSKGALIVLGIQHQSFDAYLSDYSREIRDEWAKVQGRFETYSISPSVFETLSLIGSSIAHSDYQPADPDLAERCAALLFGRTPQFLETISRSFAKCLPLHPVSAVLLCALAKSSYGQNERSIFSFLSSAEPFSFHEFLQSENSDSQQLYSPYLLFDYIKANQTSLLSLSKHGHQWEESCQVVQRAEKSCTALEIQLIKTIAVIDLLGGIYSLGATDEILQNCVEASSWEFTEAIQHLTLIKAVIRKTFDNSYGMFMGSDFDFDEEFGQAYAKTEISLVSVQKFMTDHERVIAKRHYVQTGSLRWFAIRPVLDSDLQQTVAAVKTRNDCAGAVLIVYVTDIDRFAGIREQIEVITQDNVLFCLCRRSAEVIRLSRSIAALEVLRQDKRLEGDHVARREIQLRLNCVLNRAVDLISGSITSSEIYHQGSRLACSSLSDLSSVVSRICDQIFTAAPVLNNELINRNKLSSNIAAARKLLLKAMVEHTEQENLGFTGTPAEYCIYNSLFKASTIHRCDEASGRYYFDTTAASLPSSVRQLFEETINFIRSRAEVQSTEIFELWQQRPFGLKKGPQPLLLLAFMLSQPHNLAVYLEKIFITELDDSFVDEFIVSPERVSLKWYGDSADSSSLLENTAAAVESVTARAVPRQPLAVARALVRFVLTLPGLTQRTFRVSRDAQTLKTVISNANDPIDLIYTALPKICPDLSRDGTYLTELMQELHNFYGRQIDGLKSLLFTAIRHSEHKNQLSELAERARNIKSTTGSNKLEQFAGKIQHIDKNITSCIEGIISLCVEKPQKNWTDKEIDTTRSMIPQLAMDFRQAESFAVMHDRMAGRSVFSMTFGTEPGHDLVKVVDFSPKELQQAEQIASELATDLQARLAADANSPDLIYAVIAALGMKLEGQQK